MHIPTWTLPGLSRANLSRPQPALAAAVNPGGAAKACHPRAAWVLFGAALFLAAFGGAPTVLAAREGRAEHRFPPGSYVLGGGPTPATGKDAARITEPFVLHPDQYILSGGPNPTDLIVVDDDLEVLHGAVKLFLDDDNVRSTEIRAGLPCTYGGTPLILVLKPGTKFRVRAIDHCPTEAELGPLYLHRWDGARKCLTPGRKEKSNAQLPHVFFDQEFDTTFPGAAAPARPEARRLTAGQLEALWADLGSNDPARAYLAQWAAAAAPEQAVPFLRERLKPAPPTDAQTQKRIARLIADLDSDDFEVREKASQELGKVGEPARPALQRALAMKPSAEVQRRIGELLETWAKGGLPREQARLPRVVAALEHGGTPAAREVLQALARGDAGAGVTRQAKAALERLTGRPPAP
jgi:hypothetical protein